MINEIDLNVLVLVSLGIVSFLIIFFVYIRDSETSKRLRMYEKAIEELGKSQVKFQNALKNYERNKITKDDIIEMQSVVDEKLESALSEMNNMTKVIQAQMSGFKSEIQTKLVEIKERPAPTPQPSHVAPQTYRLGGDVNTNVLEMHKSGYAQNIIARELKIPLGEVEFIIKRNKMMFNTDDE